MFPIRLSSAVESNPAFTTLARKARESNTTWLERARQACNATDGCGILLLGGVKTPHFLLRSAQSVARHDRSGSHWSHCALIEDLSVAIDSHTVLSEVPLWTHPGAGWPPERNALVDGSIGEYSRARQFPNVALIRVPCARDTVHTLVGQISRRPLEVDAVSMLHDWLGYLWGVRETGNPLQRGVGLPSAVLVETVVGAAWRDLTPGLPTLASCPEAIWQAAKHWHQYHQSTSPATGASPTQQRQSQVLSGRFCIDHRLVPEALQGVKNGRRVK
ncbi:MAG: hypothetical protein HYV17_04385 [Xanthomonadales bacterium]|nr:hypothetical protein [Xanthomonadales bacterium]